MIWSHPLGTNVMVLRLLEAGGKFSEGQARKATSRQSRTRNKQR